MATPPKDKRDNIVGAGAAGGGVGTIVAAMANSLPETSGWRTMLIVGAPVITVAVSGVWLFLKAAYIDPFVNERKHRAADAAMDKVLADARANAARVQADPNASPEHKRDVQKMVEELERLRLKKITERMQVVAIT